MASKKHYEGLIVSPAGEEFTHGPEMEINPILEGEDVGMEVEETPVAPENWITLSALSRQSNVSRDTLMRTRDLYREDHPEWFATFRTDRGQVREHLHPDLTEILRRRSTDTEIAPEGWMANGQVTKKLERNDHSLIKKIALTIKDEHPEWFQVYKSPRGRILEYYHPDAVLLIEQHFSERERSREGWTTTHALAKDLNISFSAVKRVVADYRNEYPEAVKPLVGKSGRIIEHLGPDLVEAVSATISGIQRSPEDWQTSHSLSKNLGVASQTVDNAISKYRDKHPEWFVVFRNSQGKPFEHFHPELIDIINQEIGSYSPAPEGWITNKALSDELGCGQDTLPSIVETLRNVHPEWFVVFRGKGGQVAENYHPNVADYARIRVSEIPVAPEGWETRNRLVSELHTSPDLIDKITSPLRDDQPEWFQDLKFRGRSSRVVEHYSPELVKVITEATQQDQTEYPLAPAGWITINRLAGDLSVSHRMVQRLLEPLAEKLPDCFRIFRSSSSRSKGGRLALHFDQTISELVKARISEFETVPEGWMTVGGVAKNLHIKFDRVRERVELYREGNPEWFSVYKTPRGTIYEHIHPDLIAIIQSTLPCYLNERNEKRIAANEQKDLMDGLQNLALEISEGESEESKELERLINLFGSERAVDILYQYHPEYQKLAIPYVKRILSDYLGEFLVVRGDLQLDDIELGTRYLSNPSLRDGLFEVIKNDCLSFYNKQRRSGLKTDDLSTLVDYVNDLRAKTADFATPELAEILDGIEVYWRSLFEDIDKPRSVVDELEPGRLFPDLNQRINIKEIALKKKMLIADEMGVGKSASAILAKESLGVKQALVVVPSNVIEVWRKYLSDYKNGDGQSKGYFKPGQVPNVLFVNGPEDLTSVNSAGYDYVVISHERLTDKYMAALENFDYDMLIVDEVHKLKNIGEGVWAESLIKLADRIEGEDKYLALLSGTPVPNKVGDIAMILRLLYPEKFENVSNKELTRQILQGDVLDLRSLLIPRMQMKSLAESLEMPNLDEQLHVITMSEQEKVAYEVLLEEDELTASQKLQILRRFVLNPQIFDATPDLESSKLREVGGALRETFSTKDKVVMFVNDHVEGVIRGEQNIFNQLDLPEEVEIHIIDGSVTKIRRLELQSLLAQESGRKILLVVSGQTADVGVDFSGAHEVYFYNGPWTEYVKKQELGRVLRPGLKDDLLSRSFYVEGTIEEGIHEYTDVKYKAVEKLLRGIPLSELERNMLAQDEKQVDPNLEVNPVLAEHYLSKSARMLKIYSHVKEIGEEGFKRFGAKYWREYAESYAELGSRSYQANAGRLSGTIIDNFVRLREQQPEFVRILDVASGPEMLKRHIGEEYQDQVVSVDINPHHFEEVDDKRRVGSFLNLPVADSTIDYANLSLALHYTKFSIREGNYERIEVFKELNRVLVNEGVAVINLMHNLDLKDREAFGVAIEKVGFKVLEEHSGEVSSANNFRSRVLALQKVSNCPQDTASLVQSIGSQLLNGFKLKKTSVKLKDSRKIATTFILNGKRKIETRLNLNDKKVLDEEQATLHQMSQLKRQYGSIQDIPKEEVYRSGLARIFTGKTYVLFKRLNSADGAVIGR